MTLSLHNVTRRLGGLVVVDEMSFSVPLDGLTGLIGPNGAGKSTLFAVVSGFQPADAGKILLDGRLVGRFSAEERARLGLGRTFQVPRPFAHLTVRENLAVGARDQPGERLLPVFLRPAAVRAVERRTFEKADEIIAFLNLRSVAEAPAGRLSGGQKKLLELGRALMMEPRFILLDEPFAGVNPVLIEGISEQIREVNSRGIGFLIVEHNLSHLSRLADRLLVMDRGRLLADGTPGTVLDDPIVQEAYMGGAVL